MSMLTPQGVRPPRGSRAGGASGRAIGLLVTLVVLLAAGAGAWWFLVRPTPTPSASTCPTTTAAATKPVAAAAPRTVRVNVYNATSRTGLASRVATALRARGFVVLKVANDPLGRNVTGVAELRHSPRGEAAAKALVAQLGSVVDVPDTRRDASVDVVLGAGFGALRTPAQVAAALKASPKPATPSPAASC